MIRDVEKLEEFERGFAREYGSRLTYHEALSLFTALWIEARALNAEFPGDWQEDVAPDIELARVLNGLPAA